ncbi:MAG: hypothetical protein A2289_14700 [Deltaproteobacteria bacterium RIFOXYA12_FULL_58_15]|nr:MAG: hypothetical protein A2289_14700 [Deltaproteobacteria bacterium RIFOXYA12_FULL_58_15]OGR07850.1 MAG: hypothetical protein A2341_07245 [Deltaproteobacteria bacterium RIFOXYB12_FULL_58_9]
MEGTSALKDNVDTSSQIDSAVHDVIAQYARDHGIPEVRLVVEKKSGAHGKQFRMPMMHRLHLELRDTYETQDGYNVWDQDKPDICLRVDVAPNKTGNPKKATGWVLERALSSLIAITPFGGWHRMGLGAAEVSASVVAKGKNKELRSTGTGNILIGALQIIVDNLGLYLIRLPFTLIRAAGNFIRARNIHAHREREPEVVRGFEMKQRSRYARKMKEQMNDHGPSPTVTKMVLASDSF